MKLKTVLIAIWVLMIVPTMTYGLFFDTKTSQGNSFSASTLKTNLTPEKPSPVQLEFENIEEFPSTSFILTNTGQLTSRNTLSIENISNSSFVYKISINIELDETIPLYSGLLTSINIPDYLVQNSGQVNKVGFIFSISESDFDTTKGESVTFDVKNYAWQSTLPFGSGFSDSKSMRIVITNPLPTENSD